VSSALITRLKGHRVVILIVFDALTWCLALMVFTVLRYDLAGATASAADFAYASAFVVIAQIVLGAVCRLHQGRTAAGSFEDFVLLSGVTLSAGALLAVVNAFGPEQWLPRTVPIAATFLALMAQGAGRAAWRRVLEREMERGDHPDGQRTLIVGVGDAGRQLLHSMLRDRQGTYVPVGFVEDDPQMRNRRVRGVPVVGSTSDLLRVVEATGATAAVLAMPSAGPDVVRRISRLALEAGLAVKVLPGISELIGGQVGISDIRDIDVADLLGRHQVEIDVPSIAGYVTGKRVLVTGAGGSIGSELCRQIDRYAPAELIMLDRDESALHGVQLSLRGRALLDSPEVVLADIRESRFLLELFQERKPEVVFHAAALKHLPMLEQYPGEAIKTNVWGTLSVLDAARAVGVERFVNISTDKAANPCSVLGYSKRLAEGLTSTAATEADGTYLSVRFGNVLGSRGSVLTTFAAQIADGGSVTVTHPDVTRYFMTVQEAVQLVIQAAAIGRPGEALVLDMGNPVRIADVAQQLIDLAHSDVRIVYTGLRGGEKMHEDLLATDEPDRRPFHPKVSHVSVPGLDRDLAHELDPWAGGDRIRATFADLCHRLGDSPAHHVGPAR